MWLSMLIAAIGKAVLVESSFTGVVDDSWQIEFMSTIVTQMWLAMILLIPPVLNLLPRPNSSATQPIIAILWHHCAPTRLQGDCPSCGGSGALPAPQWP